MIKIAVEYNQCSATRNKYSIDTENNKVYNFITMDNTKKFDKKANVYSESRPTYAGELIDEFYLRHGFCEKSEIADIGAGTGIFSELLLKRGSTVYAVEPNPDMRYKLEENLSGYKNFRSVTGTAEKTGLRSASADFITVAQAFHWFDVKKFKSECLRILKKNGKIFLIYNNRDEKAEITKDSKVLFAKYCPNFIGFSGGIEKNDKKISEFFDNKFGYAEFPNPLYYNKEKFIRRCLSSSYALSESDDLYGDYLREINALFDKYAVNGILTVPNATVVYYGFI